MDEEQEIEIFADEMYRHLFSRRMKQKEHRLRRREEGCVYHYTYDVGKAVLVTCYLYQHQFWEHFIRHQYNMTNMEEIKLYCGLFAIVIRHHTKNIFHSLFIVGAMILELVTFCRLHGFGYFEDAYIVWATIFKYKFKETFLKKGGWQTQRERARIYAEIYDKAKYEIRYKPKISSETEVPSKPKIILADRTWLSRFDRTICKKDFYCPSSPLNILANDLLEQDYGELPQPDIGCSPENIGTPGLIEPSKGEVEISDLGSQSTEKQVGAEMNVELDCTKRFTQLNKANADIYTFMDINDFDIQGEELYKIMSVDRYLDPLLNNGSFFEIMQKTVEMSYRKPNNTLLLAIAVTLIIESNPPERSHLIDKFLMPKAVNLAKKHTIEEFDDNQPFIIQILENIPILDSPSKQSSDNTLVERILKENYSQNEESNAECSTEENEESNAEGSTKENEESNAERSTEENEESNAEGSTEENEESNAECSTEENEDPTQLPVKRAVELFDMFIKKEKELKDGKNFGIKEILRSYSESLEVEELDLNVKIQILKQILKFQLDYIKGFINSFFETSTELNGSSKTPDEKEYAVSLNNSALKFLERYHQADRNRLDKNCDCCIIEKMELLQKCIMDTHELCRLSTESTLNLVWFKVVDMMPEIQQIKTRHVSPSSSSRTRVCPVRSYQGTISANKSSTRGDELNPRLPGVTENRFMQDGIGTVASLDKDIEQLSLSPVQKDSKENAARGRKRSSKQNRKK